MKFEVRMKKAEVNAGDRARPVSALYILPSAFPA